MQAADCRHTIPLLFPFVTLSYVPLSLAFFPLSSLVHLAAHLSGTAVYFGSSVLAKYRLQCVEHITSKGPLWDRMRSGLSTVVSGCRLLCIISQSLAVLWFSDWIFKTFFDTFNHDFVFDSAIRQLIYLICRSENQFSSVFFSPLIGFSPVCFHIHEDSHSKFLRRLSYWCQ